MKAPIITLAAGLLLAGNAHAGKSLSCQLKERAGKGTAFAWSYAHSEAPGPNTIKTSIGKIGYAEGPNFTTSITLNGRPFVLPPEHAGLIRFGKVYEHGGKVAMAYRVQREIDSASSPSELVFLVDAKGAVHNIELQPGDTEPAKGYCSLI